MFPENLSLVGFMGSGKSTVGPMVASFLGMRYVELDKEVEKLAGTKIGDIFEKHGEFYFRELESKALNRTLSGRGRVLSCGGGVIMNEENVRILRSRSLVILLWISLETAITRLQGCKDRPLVSGKGEERILRLYRQREKFYIGASHRVVKAEGRSPMEVAEEIITIWKDSWWN